MASCAALSTIITSCTTHGCTRHGKLGDSAVPIAAEAAIEKGVAPPCQLPIISMASSNHFQQLLGSLGSIQHNEPTRHVAVFDIGLTALEAHHLAALSPRVRLLRFPFHNYPAHVRISQSRKGLNYAFQLLQKELALSMLAEGRLKFPKPCCSDSVLFLDASIEVRPVGLAEIDRIVQAHRATF